jgi:hypothetical protein
MRVTNWVIPTLSAMYQMAEPNSIASLQIWSKKPWYLSGSYKMDAHYVVLRGQV